MWPRLGPSIGRDGSVYAGSGDGDYYPEQQIFGQSIVAVKQNPATKALEMTDWFTPTNAVWLRKRDLDMNVTGPIFEYKGREYIAESSKECRIWLLDTSAMGGEDHRTPVYTTPLVCNEEVQFAAAGPWGALATWEDTDGTRWVLMPFWGPKHPQFTAPDRARAGREGRDCRVHGGGEGRRPAARPGRGSRATSTRPTPSSSPTASCSASATAKTRRRRRSTSGSRTTRPRTGSRTPRTPNCTPSTRAPATELWSSGDANRLVQPLHEPLGRQRPRLHRHLRRDALRLRRRPAGGDAMRRTPVARTGALEVREAPVRCVVTLTALRRARVGARPRAGARMDDERVRRPAHPLGQQRRPPDEGRGRGWRVPLPLEGGLRQRSAAAAVPDRACPAGPAHRLPRLQGARLRGRQRRPPLLDRHGPGQAVLDHAPDLRGGIRERAREHVGLPRRSARGAEPPHAARAHRLSARGGGRRGGRASSAVGEPGKGQPC